MQGPVSFTSEVKTFVFGKRDSFSSILARWICCIFIREEDAIKMLAAEVALEENDENTSGAYQHSNVGDNARWAGSGEAGRGRILVLQWTAHATMRSPGEPAAPVLRTRVLPSGLPGPPCPGEPAPTSLVGMVIRVRTEQSCVKYPSCRPCISFCQRTASRKDMGIPPVKAVQGSKNP